MPRKTTVTVGKGVRVRQKMSFGQRLFYVLLAAFLAFVAYCLIAFEEAHIAGGIFALMSIGAVGAAMERYRDLN